MFVGHFAASVAAKAVRPQLPFWACVGAAQLVDIVWGVLVIAGVERLQLDPSLPGSPLVLEYMPWSHSLPMAVAWSALAGVAAAILWGPRIPWAGWLIGAVVFSHWLADLLVHRPDLPLLWQGPKLGLGLWNLPALEMLVELGLLGLAMCLWVAARGRAGLAARPAIGWFGAALILAIINVLPGEPLPPAGMGALALLGFSVAMAVAAVVDRADRCR
ncbi:hypothetical protein [Sandarakinorhabdus sp. AAP62]|uniref:hypothetical protein n=1 Tax=Sandarakinorhabdus sp. AAP62 TaxID=1248916 RepID=UPI000306B7F4|nr:hypothetical protein [Sandarakinorhabdus sp. AAP62]